MGYAERRPHGSVGGTAGIRLSSSSGPPRASRGRGWRFALDDVRLTRCGQRVADGAGATGDQVLRADSPRARGGGGWADRVRAGGAVLSALEFG